MTAVSRILAAGKAVPEGSLGLLTRASAARDRRD
jgi:hypothetical protein